VKIIFAQLDAPYVCVGHWRPGYGGDAAPYENLFNDHGVAGRRQIDFFRIEDVLRG